MDRMTPQLATQDCWTEADAMRAGRQQRTRAEADRASGQRRRTILTQTVELDVIPALLNLHRPALIEPRPIEARTIAIGQEQVSALTQLVLADDEPAAIAFVDALHDQGAGAEALYLELLAPTARLLGQMWEDDTCDFTDVTVGLWRLQNAMRALSHSFLANSVAMPVAPRVVLVPLPGEQHTFGLSMVFDFFRRAGWDAWTGPIETSAELGAIVRKQRVSVLGFSLACDERVADVRQEILSVRKHSRNPDIAIMVGGPGFTANPALAAEVGADATAIDGAHAVLQAAALLTTEARRR